ncbi:hypothetical protein CHS0354_005637 [Potamilus streckersoni]|uniref:Sodium-coupled monocarboxylate transporter 2 n=1 Tax=Potamilus streckersoni TaxID=2493646 RepID=A0AAE0S086_9BIVA|nr:hypothetical protein CHS0354_005637 [Potamilus streckersoni]
MKAVLWTDTFQAMMMVAGLMATLIQGSIEMGGFSKAWEIAANNERVYFDEFDPSVRHSAWSLVIGGIFLWVSVYGTNQAQVQRTLTCGNLRDAQIALWLNFPGLCVILFLSCLVGIVMYAFYSTCDPISFKLVMASDQLYPLFVMDVLSHVPGVPGLFVACIFSGTLSTISSGLNSLATVTLQDFVKPYISSSLSEKRATNFTKIMALVFGLICLGLTYVASLLGGILQAALSLFGMLGAPMLGLFTLGMIFPWANYKGAYAGLISSLVIMLWIGVGTYVYKPKNWQASISVEGCNWNLTTLATPVTMNATIENVTSTISSVFDRITSAGPSVMNNATSAVDTAAESHSEPFYPLYTLSYMWYSLTAVLIVVVVGMIVSLITGRQDPKTIDARLICPIFDTLFPYLPEKILKPLRFGVKHKSKYDISDAKTEDLPTARNRKSEKVFIARADTFDLELQVNGKLLSYESEETNKRSNIMLNKQRLTVKTLMQSDA